MTLESRGPIPIYYESLYGKRTLNPFRVHFVLKVMGHRVFRVERRRFGEHVTLHTFLVSERYLIGPF